MRVLAQRGRLAMVRGVGSLIQHAYDLRTEDAASAVGAARLAVQKVEELHGNGCAACDLRCRAYLVLGNNLRIAANFPAAKIALQAADDLRRHGTGDAHLELTWLQFRASLAISCRHFAEAEALLAMAEVLAERIDDGLEASKARIKLAIVATYQGRHDQAEEIIRAAIVRGAWTPALARSAMEVQISNFALGEQPRKAFELWQVSATLFRDAGPLERIKFEWLRSLIVAQIGGDLEPLRKVQAAYAGKDRSFEAGLVGLDLAIAATRLGDTIQARQYLGEAAPILELYGVTGGDASLAGLRALRLALSARGARPADQ